MLGRERNVRSSISKLVTFRDNYFSMLVGIQFVINSFFLEQYFQGLLQTGCAFASGIHNVEIKFKELVILGRTIRLILLLGSCRIFSSSLPKLPYLGAFTLQF